MRRSLLSAPLHRGCGGGVNALRTAWRLRSEQIVCNKLTDPAVKNEVDAAKCRRPFERARALSTVNLVAHRARVVDDASRQPLDVLKAEALLCKGRDFLTSNAPRAEEHYRLRLRVAPGEHLLNYNI